jgi:hypothetical protein
MINNLIVSSYMACPYKAFLLLSNEPQPENDYVILMNELKGEYNLSFIASIDAKNILPFQLTSQTKEDFITVNPVVKDENFEIQFDAFEINHPISNPGTKPIIKPLIILPVEKLPGQINCMRML